eukprot:TRINITY_DN4640_c0_g1_i4.p1 TRINITY_DN4640_c0_g1~~TRINITY_DN4640_c0_g1_i4.p1  ORF type:complete len:167 (-),score=27.69 TRINITY_DN4640_c0_g1_i4:106-606(-)
MAASSSPFPPLNSHSIDNLGLATVNRNLEALFKEERYTKDFTDSGDVKSAVKDADVEYFIQFLKDFNLINNLNLNEANLRSFCRETLESYNPLPYHNKYHALDVVQFFAIIALSTGLEQYITDEGLFAGFVAAITRLRLDFDLQELMEAIRLLHPHPKLRNGTVHL